MKKLILFFTFFICLSGFIISQTQNISSQERSINAKLQLEDYKNFIKLESSTNYLKKFTGYSKVGVNLAKNFISNSTIYFYDNMESGVNGWSTVTYVGNDLWHQSTKDASSLSTSWWCGIEESENYNTGQRVSNALISPSINLVGSTGKVNLLFAEKYFTEKGWDYCMVDVSTDGGNSWIHLRGGYGSAPNGSSDGWILTLLDLTPYINYEIKLRFYFDTGDELFNDFNGWFIDDVLIYDQGGIVTGKKFFDINQNGVKDINENGIKDWLITAEGNGLKITARTNIRGRYQIPLPLGTYTIKEELKSGWSQTCPATNEYAIEIATPDTLIDSLHFGNYTQAAFIGGAKFHDINQNAQRDEQDTLIPGWKIWLYITTDSGDFVVDYDRTDSLGNYRFFVLNTGIYLIEEAGRYGWTQTFPDSLYYLVEINDLNSNINNLDFGNYSEAITDFVSGIKFLDENRNGIKDSNEIGLAGFTIKLMKKAGAQFVYFRKTETDSNGYYEFRNLPPNIYKVCEVPVIGWWKSIPESCYVVDMATSNIYDKLNFGNYQIGFSSITGVVFNDLNGNGVRELGEYGLDKWNILLEGNSFYNTFVNLSTTTNEQGEYTLGNLWPGNYTIMEIIKNNWRQTFPPSLRPHFINLGPEEIRNGVYFGNVYDTTFNLAFTSFISDSFALAYKPIKRKPDKTYWETYWIKPSDFAVNDSIKGIQILLKRPPIINSISVSKLCSVVVDLNRVEILFYDYLQPNDSIKIMGLSMKVKPQSTKWILFEFTDSVGTKKFTNLIEHYEPRYPMPNAVNVLEAGAGNNLKVGIGGAHTVLHRTYKDVMKSLIDKNGRMHIGDARCLDKFTNRMSIKRQVSNLTPTKGNNKLFAEAVALRANISASDFGITPQGFGNLIFDEGGSNPMNGMSIRGIASTLDLYMSSYDDLSSSPQCIMPPIWAGLDPESLYIKIKMINNAFCGKMDTISFANELRLKPVRPLSEVPFLRLDSSLSFSSFQNLSEDNTTIPDKIVLLQNYPNPFNPSTIVEFYLPELAYVTLELYNVLGQRVATIVNKVAFDEGWNEIEISANELKLASGIYYYKFSASMYLPDENKNKEYTEIKKMIYLK